MIEPVDGLDVAVEERGVLRITLNRPDKRNALDDAMMLGLIAAFDAAGQDDRVRVVLLEGAGDSFCSGADIVARNAGGTDQKPRTGSIQRRVPTQAHRLIPLVGSVQVPVVCKVRGWCAGIGFQLALAADFTIAAVDAKFWEPFSERGFTPDSGATWMLPRRVGELRGASCCCSAASSRAPRRSSGARSTKRSRPDTSTARSTTS